MKFIHWVKGNMRNACILLIPAVILLNAFGYAGYRYYYGALANYSPAARALRASVITNEVWWLTERDLLDICESVARKPASNFKTIQAIITGQDGRINVLLVQQPNDDSGIGLTAVKTANGWETSGCGLWSGYPGFRG